MASQKTALVFTPLKQLYFSGPVINSSGTSEQYRCYNDGQTLISSSRGDDCFSVGGRVVIVRNILSHSGTVKVLCNLFETAKSFFNYPMDSSRLGILFVFNLSEHLQLLQLLYGGVQNKNGYVTT